MQILCVVVTPPFLSYLFLHFYAVYFIEGEASVNGNVCSSRSECGR